MSGDFQVTQTGSSFSAVQAGAGVFACASGSDLFQEAFAGETLVSGQVDGNAVTFRLGTVQSTHSGTVAGTSMSGKPAPSEVEAANWTFDFGGGQVLNLTGQWSAARP